MGVTCDHPSQSGILGGRDDSVRAAGLDELDEVLVGGDGRRARWQSQHEWPLLCRLEVVDAARMRSSGCRTESSVEYTPTGKLQDSEWGVRKYETLRKGGEGGQSWRPSLLNSSTNHDIAGIVRIIKMDNLK